MSTTTNGFDIAAVFHWEVVHSIVRSVAADAALKAVLDGGCGAGWVSLAPAIRQTGFAFIDINPSLELLRFWHQESAELGGTNPPIYEGNAYGSQFGRSEFHLVTACGCS